MLHLVSRTNEKGKKFFLIRPFKLAKCSPSPKLVSLAAPWGGTVSYIIVNHYTKECSKTIFWLSKHEQWFELFIILPSRLKSCIKFAAEHKEQVRMYKVTFPASVIIRCEHELLSHLPVHLTYTAVNLCQFSCKVNVIYTRCCLPFQCEAYSAVPQY